MNKFIGYAQLVAADASALTVSGGNPVVLYGYCVTDNSGNTLQFYDGVANFTAGQSVVLDFRDPQPNFQMYTSTGITFKNGLYIDPGGAGITVVVFYKALV